MSKLEKIIVRTRKLFSASSQERAQARLEFWMSLKHRTAGLTQKNAEDYLRMQHRYYEMAASGASAQSGQIAGDMVVGFWDLQEKWPDYETYLLKYVPEPAVWIALEYGCGPGRNIRKFSSRFKRIDGVDISERNLANAEKFLEGQIPREIWPKLFLTRGSDAGAAESNSYDFCFSTICMQHICVWEIRFAILQSLYRCLKPGGRLNIQMGVGVPSPNSVPYHSNHYGATGTNSACDVAVSSPQEIEDDLKKIGFINFECWIRPTGPGDDHPNWIFFTAVKPSNTSPPGP